MAGITLAVAEEQLTAALAALQKARDAKSYSIGSRSLERDYQMALKDVQYWEGQVQRLDRGAGARVRGLTLG